MRRLTAILLVVLPAATTQAQMFYDNFDEPVTDDFAAAADDWTAVWDGDGWNSALNSGGVSPNTDSNGPGDFGLPADAFDNVIVTGEFDWHDYAVEVDFFVADDDALGVVLRYSTADSCYLLIMSRDEMPAIGGTISYLLQPQTRLYRVTLSGTSQLLTPIPTQAHVAVPSLRQRLRVNIEGAILTAWIGSGDDPIDTSSEPLFSITDNVPAAPSAGLAGIYAFSMGEGLGGTFFDSFRVIPLDTDGDGKNNDDEISAGTDPFDADSDDDGVLDGDEYLWLSDSDGDETINVLDWDSDNDGLADGLELGITIPHGDTNVAAGYFTADADANSTTDPTNPDSDDGGVFDGQEDINQNGAYEPELGETDPNDGSDDDELTDAGPDVDTDTDVDTDVDTDTGYDDDTDEADAGADSGSSFGGLYGGPSCGCEMAGVKAQSLNILTILTELLP